MLFAGFCIFSLSLFKKPVKQMRILFVLLYFTSASVFGQNLTKLDINETEKAEIKGSLLTFKEFLKIPNEAPLISLPEYAAKKAGSNTA